MRSLLPLMCAVAGALREMQGALQLDESEVMEGYCDAKAGQNEYEGFCQGLWKPACDVQIVCEWMPEHCTAKPGMSDSYKQMCGKVGSSVICEMQRFCQWKGGASMAGAQLGEGYCDAKGGKNEYKGACQGLAQSNCHMQFACEWKTAHCMAKPGHEKAFKLLCENVGSKSICDAQMFCDWKSS